MPRTASCTGLRPREPAGAGAPKKDGARFACTDDGDPRQPGCELAGTKRATGSRVQVSVWHHLHFKNARDIDVSVIRVVRPNAKNTERDPRTSWFVLRGQHMPPLQQIAGLYKRRYSQEHGYRVDKQNLLWETPRLRTPEQFQTWTDMVAGTRNLLCLARPLAQATVSRGRARRENSRRSRHGGRCRPF